MDKEGMLCTHTHTHTHNTQSDLVLSSQQQRFTCPSVGEWIKKVWCVHTHTHPPPGIFTQLYKKKEVLSFAADLEGVTSSEVSQTEKDK